MMDLSRPRIHFYHPGSWINDPNGLVLVNGVYHLFYQLNPDGTSWDNIHWGHATSSDALNWVVESPALAPQPALGLPFSGTALENSADESPEELRGLLALFTRSLRHEQTVLEEQYLARFDAGSKTFVSVSSEPVIGNPGLEDFRDPKIWRSISGWHSVVACGDHLRFYRSDDLIKWEETSRFVADVGDSRGTWECPDFLSFPMPDGSTVDVLVVSIGQHEVTTSANVGYFVGTFDGEVFRPDPDTPFQPFDYGPDLYAVQSWSGVSAETPLAIGWMGNWAYAHRVSGPNYRGCLSLPRVLELKRIAGRWVLLQKPLPALSTLRLVPVRPRFAVEGRLEWRLPAGQAFLARATIAVNSDADVELTIRDEEGHASAVVVSRSDAGFRIKLERGELWDAQEALGRITEMEADSPNEDGKMTMEFYVDTCSIETFFDGGKLTATQLVPWGDSARTIVATWTAASKGGVEWEIVPLEPVSIR